MFVVLLYCYMLLPLPADFLIFFLIRAFEAFNGLSVVTRTPQDNPLSHSI